jgi:hypothetical protein
MVGKEVILINALLLVQLLLLIVLFLVVLTQWAIPFWRGTPIFPIFRGERRLERELERARQRRLEAELEQRLKREEEVNPTTGGIVPHEGQVYPRLEERGHKGEGDESVPN